MAAQLKEPASGGLDPAALAAALIRFPSVTPKDEGAIPHLAGVLKGLGFVCHVEEFAEPGTAPVLNLYARFGKTGRNLCFAGHMDVVPPGDLNAWTTPPFAATVKDGMLWGRGAVDMKGAIACFAAAAARFVESRGGSFAGSISLLITGDEEGPRTNGTRKMLDWLESRGERLDGCIVGEPTNRAVLGDAMKIGRRGNIYAYLTAEGTQGHTGYPHLADNAAHRLVAMLHALIGAPLDQGSEHFDPSHLQIATIDVANPAENVIPGQARATLNIRFNNRWSSASVKAWLKEKLDRAGGRYTLRFRESAESFLVPPGEMSALVAAAVTQVTGRTPELSTAGGTSDACFIHRHCPLAEFGLVGQLQHKVDECVPLADLAALTEIYRAMLEGYFAGA